MLLGGLVSAVAPASAGSSTPAVRGTPVRAVGGPAAAHGGLVLLLGRALFGLDGPDGKALPAAVTMPQVAQALTALGVHPAANVVVDWTGSLRHHRFYRIYASWSDLYAWQRSGGTVESAGLDHLPAPAQSLAAFREQACGSRAALSSRGSHPELYAYAAGPYTEQTEQVVTDCGYRLGRTYTGIRRLHMPWNSGTGVAARNGIARTLSLAGGPGTSYLSASRLQAQMTAPYGQVAFAQFYDFVTGVRRTPGENWDCRPGVPHHTYTTEVYCMADFLTALRGALQSGVRPLSVSAAATALGR